jgi:hypothetical protein
MQYETAITLAAGWQKIFEQHNIEWVIIEGKSPLAQALENEYHWQVLYRDNIAVVLKKLHTAEQ